MEQQQLMQMLMASTQPQGVGPALAAPPPVVPQPPQNPEEFQQRVGLWGQFWNKAKNDPNFQQALLTFGARMLQRDPRAGGTLGNGAQALLDAMGLYNKLEMQDAQMGMAQQQQQFQQNMQAQQLGLQKEGVDLQRQGLDLQRSKLEGDQAATQEKLALEKKELDIRARLAAANELLTQARADALKNPQKAAVPGAQQQLIDQLATVKFRLNPEAYDGNKDKAWQEAFNEVQQRASVSKEQYLANMMQRIPPEVILMQLDPQNKGEDAKNYIGDYYNTMVEYADLLYGVPEEAPAATPEASAGGEATSSPASTEAPVEQPTGEETTSDSRVGKDVTLNYNGKEQTGKVIGIANDGRLIVRLTDGTSLYAKPEKVSYGN